MSERAMSHLLSAASLMTFKKGGETRSYEKCVRLNKHESEQRKASFTVQWHEGLTILKLAFVNFLFSMIIIATMSATIIRMVTNAANEANFRMS